MASNDHRSKTTKNVDKPTSWTCDYGCAVFLRCFPSRRKTPPKVTVDGGHRHDCPYARMAKKERSRPPGETARNFRSLKWLGARRIELGSDEKPDIESWDLEKLHRYTMFDAEVLLDPSGPKEPTDDESLPDSDASTTVMTRRPGTGDRELGPREYNQNSLRDWLKAAGFAKPDDLRIHSYKGYGVEAPKIQLIRAKNFLADEGPDRTCDWELKFARLAEYLSHLKKEYKGEDWGYDLREAIGMLRTHWLVEKHDIEGTRKGAGVDELNVHFDRGAIPRVSKRLPPVPGSKITALEGGYRPPRPDRNDRPRLSAEDYGPGVVYTPFRLREAPAPDNRDPMAYTKASVWYRETERTCAEWARDNRLWHHADRDGPMMPLPSGANWHGPVVESLLDIGMRSTYDTLQSFRHLGQKLRRCLDRSAGRWGGSREVLAETLLNIDAGLAGLDSKAPGLSLPASDSHKGMVSPQEVDWLRYLCEPVPSVPKEKNVELGPLDRIVHDTVIRLLQDPQPSATFSSLRPELLSTLVKELNHWVDSSHKRAPSRMRRHHFSSDEAWEACKKLEAMGILRTDVERWGPTYHDDDLEPAYHDGRWVGVPIPEHFSEEAIRWTDPENVHGQNTAGAVNREECEKKGGAKDENKGKEKGNGGDSSMSEASQKKPVHHERQMPSKSHLRSWDQVRSEPWPSDDRERTLAFYRSLGWRFGHALRCMEDLHKANLRELDEKPSLSETHYEALRETLDAWDKEYSEALARRKWFDDRNGKAGGRRSLGMPRIMPTFEDVVGIAEPERAEMVAKGEPNAAAEMVRAGIIREAYEGKTLLWPRIPGFDEDDVEEKDKITLIRGWRRESFWAFGHPSVRPKAKQFFNINRWPVHLQIPGRQAEIRMSGPEGEYGSDPDSDTETADDEGSDEEFVESFAELVDKRVETIPSDKFCGAAM